MNNRIVGIIGLVGLICMAVFVYFNPYATKWQSGTLWIIVALLAGACVAVLPGLFELKIKGWLRATGSIAMVVFLLRYPPTIMDKDLGKPTERMKYYAALNDTSTISTIPVDYVSHSNEAICVFSKTAMIKYFGEQYNSDTITFYRKSDGKIYSSEKCIDVTEFEIIGASNKVIRQLGSPRAAYEFIFSKIK